MKKLNKTSKRKTKLKKIGVLKLRNNPSFTTIGNITETLLNHKWRISLLISNKFLTGGKFEYKNNEISKNTHHLILTEDPNFLYKLFNPPNKTLPSLEGGGPHSENLAIEYLFNDQSNNDEIVTYKFNTKDILSIDNLEVDDEMMDTVYFYLLDKSAKNNHILILNLKPNSKIEINTQ